jgi:Spy/CpxP family protein refolding chaperone
MQPKMKSSNLLSLLTIGALAISTAGAQTSATPQTQTAQSDQSSQMKSHRRAMGGPRVERLARQLNLTVDQQSQARTIFADARTQRQALAPQLRTQHQAMAAAIKSNNQAQIDQLAQQNAQLTASARAIRAKAMAKFYTTLTPDQKTKFDSLRANGRVHARGQARVNKAKNG